LILRIWECSPLGVDESEDDKSKALASSLAASGIIHRPYGYDLY